MSAENPITFRSDQKGYLLEIPLVMMATGVLMAILFPMLPIVWRKMLAVAGMAIWIGGCYYMIVIPGWQPNSGARLRHPWNLVAFIAIAIFLIMSVGVYVFCW